MTTRFSDAAKMVRLIQLMRAHDPEMPAQTMETFFLVAQAGELTMQELQAKLGMAQSTISRNVAALSQHPKSGRTEALHLVELFELPSDRRVKVARLAPKGVRLMGQIAAELARHG